MPTKQQTNASNQQTINFDPTSMSQYQNFWGMATPILNSLISNPYGSSMYQQNLAQGMQYATQAGQNNIQNALANFRQTGINPSSGVGQSLMSSLGRYGSSLGSQAFYNAGNTAQQGLWNALGIQSSRTPLVTGQTGTSQSTTQTSGLGTLTPLFSGVLGALSGSLGSVTQTTSPSTQSFGQNPLNQVDTSMNTTAPTFSNQQSSFWSPSNLPGQGISTAPNAPAQLTNPLAGLGI